MSKFKISYLLATIFSLAIFGLGTPSFAETGVSTCGMNPNDPLGLDCAAATGLTKQDPRIIASKIINVVLGLLGIIATVLIVYAGFLWMTSAGNEEQSTKAKNIIFGAVIGLVIILCAYAISNYVIGSLYKATGQIQ